MGTGEVQRSQEWRRKRVEVQLRPPSIYAELRLCMVGFGVTERGKKRNKIKQHLHKSVTIIINLIKLNR